VLNLLGDNTDTIKENTETLDISKEVALKVNAEKTIYVNVSLLECRAKSEHKDS
jgi:hypothetical protein